VENKCSAGTQTRPLQLPPKLEKLALKAAKALDLLYTGVDILEDERKAVVLKVNGSPSWQRLQRATGVNVAEELVQYVMNFMKH